MGADSFTNFYPCVLSGSPIPETETNDEVPPTSAVFQRLRGRVSGSAPAKPDGFAITVDGNNTIGVIVPLIWNAAYQYELPTA